MNNLCLSPLLLLASLLVAVFIGSPSFCMAANLRANSISSSNDATEVSESDLVDTSAFLVVQLEGYGMDDLANLTPKQHAVLDCAFHQAFDEVHGDHDGLYLSGQQIVATNEELEDDDSEVDDEIDSVELRKKRKYVYRPRDPVKKRKPVPIEYPPPKPPKRQYELPKIWNIYWHIDTSGRCNLCPDDDSMGSASNILSTNSLQQNESQQLAFESKKARDEGIASDMITSEDSVDSIAYSMRAKLIEGTCHTKEDNDDSFEYIRHTSIFVLSRSEFEDSIAAIAASREASDVDTNASLVAMDDSESKYVSPELLPFYYGGLYSNRGNANANGLKMIKIGLSGVGCGPWNNTALLDLNSGLHDSINSLGFRDKGHIIDKIKGRRQQHRSQRRYFWNCHYDVYAKVDLEGDVLDEPSLENIGDALCDDMIRNSGSEKFQNTIDCQLQLLSVTEYNSIVTATEKVGLPVASE